MPLGPVGMLKKQVTILSLQNSDFSSNIITERHDRVVNIPASFSLGPGIKSRSGEHQSWLTEISGFQHGEYEV
jgi:hypothetical protein